MDSQAGFGPVDDFGLIAISPDPDFARRALALLKSGNAAQAALLAREGTIRFPWYATGFLVLTQCFREMNRLEEAYQAALAGLYLLPDSIVLQQHVNELYVPPPINRDEPMILPLPEPVRSVEPAPETPPSVADPESQGLESVDPAPFTGYDHSSKPESTETPELEAQAPPPTGATVSSAPAAESENVPSQNPDPDPYEGFAPPAVHHPAPESEGDSEEEASHNDGVLRPVSATLAEIYVQQGEFGEAVRAYRALAESEPGGYEKYGARLEELEEILRQQLYG
jgi:tetratricopeptide (TPR) repeat protein